MASLVVVLNETQDLVNIAGTVRAMRNMGLSRLRLVRPAEFDAYRIAGIAHGSEALLERIEFFDALDDALADAAHVVGTTARRREAAYVWQTPRAAAPEILAATAFGPVALVFGREDKGLSNADLDRCDRLLTIPTDPAASSLNLAQAVLLVTYELRMAAIASTPLPRPRRTAPPATPAQLHEMFDDIEAALAAVDFFKKRNPAAILRTVRAAARRAALDAREAKLFRAMAIEVVKHLDRMKGRA
ncbi:MAG: TrmJ/YjtD family RNA methyltransferase [Gemmatimonadetes bacterium]|nr:TrmJ/YjtD family RNA methyltransferase [Gemmatimonadota bacterium]